MGETMKRVQMLLEPGQHEALRRRAEAAGTSVAVVARRAIDRGLEALEEESVRERRWAALERARALREAQTGPPHEVDVAADIRALREDRDGALTEDRR
jgi:hypothetical protein